MTIDPETLMAYADGELDDLSIKRVERAIAEDPALAAQVEAHRALRSRLKAHFDPVAAAPVPEQLSAMLETNVTDIRERRPRSLPAPGRYAALAATLVLGLVVGQAVDLNPSPVGDRSGTLVAQAGLQRALETQLASVQPTDAETRIGLTFRNGEGAVCRTFEGRALAGIACRSGGAWQLRNLVGTPARQSDYRQAGSAEMLDAAQGMMAGEPMDADAERAALGAGWK